MCLKRYVGAGLVLLITAFVTASVGYAETNVDVRLKLGNAAGIDTTEFTNFPGGATSGDGGGNFQIEMVASQKQETGVTLVVGGGIFARNHKGNINDVLFPPTSVEYKAAGLSGTVGVGVNANANLHFEGRLELDLGRGKPTLTSPFAFYNSVTDGAYGAAAVIVGGYYTVGKPGLQIGLELGVQSFSGEYQIWNNFGFWNDAKEKGSGGIANFVIGARF
jgi:hypothetical protein